MTILDRQPRKPRWAGIWLSASLIAASAASVTMPADAASAGGPAATANLGQLHGVFCTSAASCWAVGSTDVKGVQLNRILHWTGRKWFKVAVPNPAGTVPGDINALAAVRCAAAADCWAVGQAEGSDQIDHNQALHWNGKKWLAVRIPSPGAAFNSLSDVTCTARSNCWAVGAEGPIEPALAGTGVSEGEPASGKFFELNEVLHWNGKKWGVAPAPNPGGTGQNAISELNSVRCVSKADCWAGGDAGTLSDNEVFRNQMLHWNGRKWIKATVPNPAGITPNHFNDVVGLSCVSPGNCWAAGSYGATSRSLNEVLHWNGRKWFKVRVPNPDGVGASAGNRVLGITCSSATDCWAVGDSGGEAGKPEINQALHWNGARWSKISTPNPGGTQSGDSSALIAVRCTAAANCWAVGFDRTGGGNEVDQILHWTGGKWIVVS